MAPRFLRRLSELLWRSLLHGRGRSRPRMRGLRGVGEAWEDLAAKHLERAGYRILERNFRAKPGEIDFVAKEGNVICFIEVKGRRGLRFGRPEEAVGPEKQRRIFRAAEAWIRLRRPETGPRRFDVVSILERDGETAVEILRSAFEGPVPPRRRPGLSH
jgi:putative endonuclease